jgi:hypothetical protein
MQERIPQSIAKRIVFKAFYSADHVTAATGKTIAVVISKDGGAFANPAAGATNATEIGSGWYYVDLGTGDTDTLGPLIIRGTEGTIDPAELIVEVVKATNAGFAALPDAAADAAGGLPISDAGSLDLDGLATALATVDGKVVTVDTVVDAIKAKTDNLPAAPAAVGSQMDLVNAPNATAIAALQSGLAKWLDVQGESSSLSVQISGLVDSVATEVDSVLTLAHGAGEWTGGSTGTGARTVTFTVTDGTDPLQDAKVRVTLGGTTYLTSTDASGVAAFALDDAAYSYAVTLNGYAGATGSLTVDGDESEDVALTIVTPVAATDPDLTTGYCTTYDGQGNVATNQTVTFALSTPTYASGKLYNTTPFTATSDDEGLLQVELIRGATYTMTRPGLSSLSIIGADAPTTELPT